MIPIVKENKMEMNNVMNTEYLNSLCCMSDESEELMKELKIKNTSLWKMIVLHRITINPAKALKVQYLDSDLVAYGIRYISDRLHNNYDSFNQDEKSELFVTITLLILYDRYRVCKMPLAMAMPDFIDVLCDKLELGEIRQVLTKDIWEYYLDWVNNGKIFYDDMRKIDMELACLIKDQNSIKNID